MSKRRKTRLIIGLLLAVILIGAVLVCLNQEKPVVIYRSEIAGSKALTQTVVVYEDGTCRVAWIVPRWMNKTNHSSVLPIEPDTNIFCFLINRLTFSYKRITEKAVLTAEEMAELAEISNEAINCRLSGTEPSEGERIYQLSYKGVMVKGTDKDCLDNPEMQKVKLFFNNVIPDDKLKDWYFGL